MLMGPAFSLSYDEFNRRMGVVVEDRLILVDELSGNVQPGMSRIICCGKL